MNINAFKQTSYKYLYDPKEGWATITLMLELRLPVLQVVGAR